MAEKEIGRMIVRRATPADRDAIVAFNLALAQETEGKALDAARLTAGVQAALDSPDVRGPYTVAEVQGELVGQMATTVEWSDWRNGWWWWLQSVYVRPDWRRRGVFGALYAHVEDSARRTPGVIGVRLYVERENAMAQRTYARFGFEATHYLLLEKPVSDA